MSAPSGLFRKLLDTLSLLSVLGRLAVGLFCIVGVVSLAGLVVGGALLGAQHVVVQLLPVIIPAAALAAIAWCLAPVARREEKTLRAAIGSMVHRSGISLFVALIVAMNIGLVDEDAALKWITIGSAALLALLYAYERLDRWYSSKSVSSKDNAKGGPTGAA